MNKFANRKFNPRYIHTVCDQLFWKTKYFSWMTLNDSALFHCIYDILEYTY